MADWKGTLTLTASRIAALDDFIHQPDTRTGDVFNQGVLEVGGDTVVDWIIKHDLFEGVVVHFSLMAEDGTRFVAGAEGSLSRAGDLLGEHVIEHEGKRYRITVSQS